MAKISQRSLTKHLAEMGQQIHTVDDNGDPITREQALAALLWNMALGYEEQTRDDEGNLKTVKHKPASWALQAIWDRREGRAAPTVMEDEGRIKAADKVRDLAKNRVNALAAKAAPATKGPPKFKPKRKEP